MEVASIAVAVLVVTGVVGALAATIVVSARAGRKPDDGPKRGAR